MQFLYDSDKEGLLVGDLAEDTMAMWQPSADFKALQDDPDQEVRFHVNKILSIVLR